VDILVGTTLGGYTLVRPIGSGGMGTVYLAEDRAIGQQVAIKVVRTDEGDYLDTPSEEQAAERFRQEARAVAGLDHLHILPLYRYGEEEVNGARRAYMVMQYRPEGSLGDWLRRRAGLASGESAAAPLNQPAELPAAWPLSLAEADEYLRQAASALQYAHDRGIVHRDVKPANFLLRFDAHATGNLAGGVFLLLSDFGLAKFFSALSASSRVFGTPVYMAPEQFEGAAGPESDQYALAVMIYYFLAGRPPFEGDPIHLMHQHINVEAPPVRAFAPTVPASVESVLARALAKRPGERYPSIAAFAEVFSRSVYEASRGLSPQFSLPAFNRGSQGLSPAQTPVLHSSIDQRTTHNAPTVFATPGEQSMPPTMIQAMPTRTYPASAVPNTPVIDTPPAAPAQAGQQPRVGRRSALGWIIGGIAVIGVGGAVGAYFYLHRAPALAKYILRGHTSAVTAISWSPDGTQLASASDDQTVRLWSASSQATTLVYRYSAPVQAVAWNFNGTLFASGGRDDTVQIWGTNGLMRYRTPDLAAPVNALAWDLDYNRIFIGTSGAGLPQIAVEQKTVIHQMGKSVIRALALSPDMRYLAIGGQSGGISIHDLYTMRAQFYRHSRATPVLALAWSPDGARLASGGADRHAQVLDARTGEVLRRLVHNGVVNGVAWDPSGADRLATACSDGLLRVWNVASGAHTAYQGHTAAVTALAWRPGALTTGSADTTIIIWKV
jgi:serine/threonine protein kinase/WD40 repeat protein